MKIKKNFFYALILGCAPMAAMEGPFNQEATEASYHKIISKVSDFIGEYQKEQGSKEIYYHFRQKSMSDSEKNHVIEIGSMNSGISFNIKLNPNNPEKVDSFGLTSFISDFNLVLINNDLDIKIGVFHEMDTFKFVKSIIQKIKYCDPKTWDKIGHEKGIVDEEKANALLELLFL